MVKISMRRCDKCDAYSGMIAQRGPYRSDCPQCRGTGAIYVVTDDIADTSYECVVYTSSTTEVN